MDEESRKASDMGKLYFVRHGQTVWNVENKICGASESPLTELGHEQAMELGRSSESMRESLQLMRFWHHLFGEPMIRREKFRI